MIPIIRIGHDFLQCQVVLVKIVYESLTMNHKVKFRELARLSSSPVEGIEIKRKNLSMRGLSIQR